MEIKIIISEEGDVSVEVNGVVDNSCHALTDTLQRALGVSVKTTDKPQEYHEIDRIKVYG